MPGSSPLAEQLAERIDAEGPMPFASFMETALYDPEHGYYADPGFTTGRQGDFATAPDVGPLLGATLARAVERFAREDGRLVELGPGTGRLVLDVLESLSAEARERLQVVLVEPFEERLQALAEELRSVGVEPRTVQDLAELEPARTLLIANEVLDALPTEVLRRGEQGFEQLAVDRHATGFSEAWQPAPDERVKEAERWAERLPRDHRYELTPGLPELLDAVDGALAPGAALIFDYGGRFEDVWPQRPEGTLRGFREHRQVDPLSAPGQTDITYDVDFSRTMALARDRELEVKAFGAQERLLVHLGLMEVAREREALLAAKQLLVPGSFAGRFQALVVGRGGTAQEARLKVDLDDPGLWDRGLAEPLGSMEGDLEEALDEELDQAGDPLER